MDKNDITVIISIVLAIVIISIGLAVRSYYADISYHRQLEEFTTQCINSGGTPIMNSDMKACIKK